MKSSPRFFHTHMHTHTNKLTPFYTYTPVYMFALNFHQPHLRWLCTLLLSLQTIPTDARKPSHSSIHMHKYFPTLTHDLPISYSTLFQIICRKVSRRHTPLSDLELTIGLMPMTKSLLIGSMRKKSTMRLLKSPRTGTRMSPRSSPVCVCGMHMCVHISECFVCLCVRVSAFV